MRIVVLQGKMQGAARCFAREEKSRGIESRSIFQFGPPAVCNSFDDSRDGRDSVGCQLRQKLLASGLDEVLDCVKDGAVSWLRSTDRGWLVGAGGVRHSEPRCGRWALATFGRRLAPTAHLILRSEGGGTERVIGRTGGESRGVACGAGERRFRRQRAVEPSGWRRCRCDRLCRARSSGSVRR
jgi:hypothetical protein